MGRTTIAPSICPDSRPTSRQATWLGLFKSFDGGKTWKSNLIPGYPQDVSATGLISPLKGYDAAADPLVRAGSNGLFFYSAIAFQRAAIPGGGPIHAGIEKAPQSPVTRRLASSSTDPPIQILGSLMPACTITTASASNRH